MKARRSSVSAWGRGLFTRSSEEGALPGLGWIDGCTVKFDRSRMHGALRVPHMGWADTWMLRETALFAGLSTDAQFYYVHSYHIVCRTPEEAIIASHHGYDFTAGVQRANVVGVQFHPEKSHRYGLQFLRNFITWQPPGAKFAGSAA